MKCTEGAPELLRGPVLRCQGCRRAFRRDHDGGAGGASGGGEVGVGAELADVDKQRALLSKVGGQLKPLFGGRELGGCHGGFGQWPGPAHQICLGFRVLLDDNLIAV